MNSIFKIVDLKKSYFVKDKKIDVLKGINLEIEEGKITFILGPSGAGKSTLLHILGTLDSPSDGKVFFRNELIHSLDDRSKARWRNQKIGFIFQFHYLLNEFLAYENVMLPHLFLTKNFFKSKKKSIELLDSLSLSDRIYHKPNELSGGEQQRVAIARALINDPEIILADEPTGNLDSKNSENIMEIFKKINFERKTTFLIITHNEELVKHGDRVVKLVDGVIQDF
ncbi:MAG: ABC transporter ATP-binding protein [candidate division WOR-3 bacterium]